MKLGLTYFDSPKAPTTPLNAQTLRSFRPDFLRLPIGSLAHLERRLADLGRLRMRGSLALPVEHWSDDRIVEACYILQQDPRSIARVEVGISPATAGLSLSAMLQKIEIVAASLMHWPAIKLALGLGNARWEVNPDYHGGRGWIRNFLDAEARGLPPIIRERYRAIVIEPHGHGRPRAAAARQIWKMLAEASSVQRAIMVDVGWPLGVPLGHVERLLALRASGRWFGTWRPRRRAMAPLLSRWLRDSWFVDAWQIWSQVGAAAFTFHGVIEHAPADAWSIIGMDGLPSSAWTRLRIAAFAGGRYPNLAAIMTRRRRGRLSQLLERGA